MMLAIFCDEDKIFSQGTVIRKDGMMQNIRRSELY